MTVIPQPESGLTYATNVEPVVRQQRYLCAQACTSSKLHQRVDCLFFVWTSSLFSVHYVLVHQTRVFYFSTTDIVYRRSIEYRTELKAWIWNESKSWMKVISGLWLTFLIPNQTCVQKTCVCTIRTRCGRLDV